MVLDVAASARQYKNVCYVPGVSQLVLDATALTASALGAAGPDDRALADLVDPARRALEAIVARRDELGFLELPDDRASARACMDFARTLDPAIDTVVVLGIGGSCLPARALHSALAPPFDALMRRSPGMPRRLLFADNIDPVTFAALLAHVSPERTLWNVVSKSGGTVETCAQLLVIVDHLERALGLDRVRERLVCTTDPTQGALRAVAAARRWATFEIPPAVSGRLGVLTPVGLLPAALAGLDVSGLLDGARRMRERVLAPDLATNPALMLASLLHHHHTVRGRSIVVAMTYVDGLYDALDWWRQLWAESLGKAGRGATPIAARCAPEQHSQLQLWADGPDDKVYLAVTASERGGEVSIPASALASSHGDLRYLGGHGLGELLDVELAATVSSLVGRGRPVGRLTLRRMTADALGELVMLLEMASLIAGPLYGVDPVGEPGVEEGKRRAFAALGRPGYEAIAVELSKGPEPDPKYVL
jgi:glucose-6-phosphate isomerase